MIISKLQNKTERFLSKVRTYLINKFKINVSIGKGSVVYYRSPIWTYARQSEIIIGNNCSIGCSKRGYHGSMPFFTTLFTGGQNSRISIGDNSRINGVYIHAESSISIGNNCLIASGVIIVDSNGHELCCSDRIVSRDIPSPITIGNNVWIGLNSVILKGSCIGNNSVVSAGSVVKGTFPDNALISGNPATVVKLLSITV